MPDAADTISAADSIDRLLAAEIEGARQLLGVLRREQQALTGRDPDTVEQAVADKSQAIATLQQLTLRRHTLAGSLPPPGPHTPVASRRSELEQLLVELRQQNEINGALVQRRLQHARQALAVLRGQSGQTDLYDPRGALEYGSAGGRSIISA
jgi:flagellar biosynthesis/type III secretory pathway chaperone